MSKYKPKAEVMFEAKMKAAVEAYDFDRVAELFHWYGCYLMLIEPMPAPKTKALEHVPHGEPTLIEEQAYVLSGGAAEFSARLREMIRYHDDQMQQAINLPMPQVRPKDDSDALYQPVIDTSKFPHSQPFIDKYTL